MSKKRLDHDDRINLQAGIAKGYSLRMIAKILNKSRSTIYREIINNSYIRNCKKTFAHCIEWNILRIHICKRMKYMRILQKFLNIFLFTNNAIKDSGQINSHFNSFTFIIGFQK